MAANKDSTGRTCPGTRQELIDVYMFDHPGLPTDRSELLKVVQDGFDLGAKKLGAFEAELVECREQVARKEFFRIECEMGYQIRFDGPPGMPAPRFVEVETLEGKGIRIGEWKEDPKAPGEWLLVVEPQQDRQLWPGAEELAKEIWDELVYARVGKPGTRLAVKRKRTAGLEDDLGGYSERPFIFAVSRVLRAEAKRQPWPGAKEMVKELTDMMLKMAPFDRRAELEEECIRVISSYEPPVCLPDRLVEALDILSKVSDARGYEGQVREGAFGVRNAWRDCKGKLPTVAEVEAKARDEAVEVCATWYDQWSGDPIDEDDTLRDAHARGELFDAEADPVHRAQESQKQEVARLEKVIERLELRYADLQRRHEVLGELRNRARRAAIQEVCEWMEHGWPKDYPATWARTVIREHFLAEDPPEREPTERDDEPTAARQYEDHVEQLIETLGDRVHALEEVLEERVHALEEDAKISGGKINDDLLKLRHRIETLEKDAQDSDAQTSERFIKLGRRIEELEKP